MLKFNKETRDELIALQKEKGIYLEGNIVKIIDPEADPEFIKYLKEAKQNDTENRRKRLEITKQIQSQNRELTEWRDKNEKTQDQLKKALQKAEKSKGDALNDLEVLQKRTQYELIGSIVKVSLWIVGCIGAVTTILFMISLFKGLENKIIETTWTNIIGILLTNSFSIIGTIMGVKYANSNGSSPNKDKPAETQATLPQASNSAKCDFCDK